MGKRTGVAAVVAVAAVGVGSFFAVNAASASRSITATKDNPVYWLCQNKATKAQTSIRVYDGSNAYPACGSNYDKLFWSQRGPAGQNGAPGQDATLTVSASTAVSDRDDSGAHGDWAKDAMTRVVTVTRQHASQASKCGPSAVQCWFFTGTVIDNGTFRTVDGALSPNAGTPIHGNVSGTFSGGAQVEFYADYPAPSADRVPVTQAGDAPATSRWFESLFPDGTRFAAESLPSYSWTYGGTALCEQFTETWANGADHETDIGDIQGVNHCS